MFQHIMRKFRKTPVYQNKNCFAESAAEKPWLLALANCTWKVKTLLLKRPFKHYVSKIERKDMMAITNLDNRLGDQTLAYFSKTKNSQTAGGIDFCTFCAFWWRFWKFQYFSAHRTCTNSLVEEWFLLWANSMFPPLLHLLHAQTSKQIKSVVIWPN